MEDDILAIMGDHDEPECFARIDRTHCNALNEKECNECPFFKSRGEIKNNPYYGYSYKSSEEHEAAMKKYRVNPEDVIY